MLMRQVSDEIQMDSHHMRSSAAQPVTGSRLALISEKNFYGFNVFISRPGLSKGPKIYGSISFQLFNLMFFSGFPLSLPS